MTHQKGSILTAAGKLQTETEGGISKNLLIETKTGFQPSILVDGKKPSFRSHASKLRRRKSLSYICVRGVGGNGFLKRSYLDLDRCNNDESCEASKKELVDFGHVQSIVFMADVGRQKFIRQNNKR
jgi:hypothetical protein